MPKHCAETSLSKKSKYLSALIHCSKNYTCFLNLTNMSLSGNSPYNEILLLFNFFRFIQKKHFQFFKKVTAQYPLMLGCLCNRTGYCLEVC